MADSNTPTWLQETPADPVAPSPLQTEPAPLPTNTVASPTTADSGGDEADLPAVILTMRLANMGVSVAMIVVSVRKSITLCCATDTQHHMMMCIPPSSQVIQLLRFRSFSTYVLAIYAILGSLLICCLETQLKFVRVLIAVNFGFLFDSIFRFIFYLMMGSVAWSYGKILGWPVGIAFVAVALFNTYVLCRYPAYRKVREKIAEEEDKRIESRISKEVRKQAANHVMGG